MKRFSNWQKCSSLLTALLFFCATTLPIGCGSAEDAEKSAETQPSVEQYANAEQMEYWIAQMDPFVTQNADWTFTLDWEGFLLSITATHPEVVAYFENGGVATDDTVSIELLLENFPIVNEVMKKQYEAYQNLPDGTNPAIWSNGYWWGRKVCYSGNDAKYAEYLLCMGALPVGILNIFAGAVLAAMCYWAGELNDECPSHGFCITYTWAAVFWMGCA